MNFKKSEIRDHCRSNFNKYTRKAFRAIPKIDDPVILDIGCGTGVPTLEITKLTNCKIHAIDSDKECLAWLKEKITRLNLSDKITVIHGSVLKTKLQEDYYDIILAEGILNITGFDRGLKHFSKYLKTNGYFMIHDDYYGKDKKLRIIDKYHYELVESFNMDEKTWWDDYYSCLEAEIERFEKKCDTHQQSKKIFSQEKSEIEWYKKEPSRFRSTYYILKKN